MCRITQRTTLHLFSNGESISDYIEYMSNDGVWADAPIIRATADAMDVEIMVITNGEYIPVFMPSSGNPTETIFIGNIIDYHSMATAPRREAQQIPYGGRTSDGVSIEYSACFDVPMTWLYNLLSNHRPLRDYVNNVTLSIGKNFNYFKSCNSADMKKD